MQRIFRHLSKGHLHKVKKQCEKLIRSHSKGHFPSNHNDLSKLSYFSKLSSFTWLPLVLLYLVLPGEAVVLLIFLGKPFYIFNPIIPDRLDNIPAV